MTVKIHITRQELAEKAHGNVSIKGKAEKNHMSSEARNISEIINKILIKMQESDNSNNNNKLKAV